MRLVVTGQAGLRKEEFFNKIGELTKASGKSLEVYPVEEQFSKTFKRTVAPFYWDSYFKNRDDFCSKYSSALDEVLTKIEHDRPLNAILDIHAVYRRQGIPFCAMNFEALRKFNPDMFVTLVDDIYRIQKRIREHPASRVDKATAEITLKDVIDWRSEEIMATEMMAHFVATFCGYSCPHYTIPIRGHEDVLYQLVFDSIEAMGNVGEWKPKVYIAFPITAAYQDASLRSERDNFRARMKSNELDLIIFDPYGIEERVLLGVLEATLKRSTLEKTEPPPIITLLTTEGEELQIDRRQAELVCDRDIPNHVATRDYRLISQSDFLVAFRPAISRGVRAEIQHANQLGKPVYAVWTSNDPPKDDFEHLAITKQTTTTQDMVALIRTEVIPFLKRGT